MLRSQVTLQPVVDLVRFLLNSSEERVVRSSGSSVQRIDLCPSNPPQTNARQVTFDPVERTPRFQKRTTGR